MVSFLCIVSLLAVSAFLGWLLWLAVREINEAKSETAHWKKAARQYLDNTANRQQQEELERKKTAINYILALSGELIQDMAPLPDINDTEAFFGSMSPDLRNKVSVGLGTEFQQGVAQLVGQELEAVSKLREIRLRFALLTHKRHYATQLAPVNLKFLLDSVARMEEVSREYDAKITDERFRQAADYFKGLGLDELAFQVEQGAKEIPPSRLNAIGLFLPEKTGGGEGGLEADNVQVRVLDELNQRVKPNPNGANRR